jgi:hypothetical protein
VSPQDSNLSNPVRYRKPKADVYTLLLGIALVALIIACIFAYLEVADYEGDVNAPSVSVPVEQPAGLVNGLPDAAASPGVIQSVLFTHG